MGWSLKTAFQRREQQLALATVGFALVFLVVLPLASPALTLGSKGAAVQAMRELLGRQRLWLLLWRSTALSLAVTAGSLLFGVPLGILLARTDAIGRRAVSIALALPVSLPPFLLVLGWYYLLGRGGWVGSAATSSILFSDLGLVAVLCLAFSPVAMALTGLAARAIDPSIEAAARVVARPFRVVVRVVVPAIWPSIALAAVVLFALAFSELGVPMFLRRDVYAAAVFGRLGGVDYQPGEALVLTLPLLPVAFLLFLLERLIFRTRSFAVVGATRWSGEPLPLGPWRMPVSALGWLLAGLVFLPVACLVVKAGSAGLVGAIPFVGSSASNSLVDSLLAASIIAGLALVLGHAIARRGRGSSILDALSMLAFVTPASVLGTGLLTVYNRPMSQWLYGSFAIIVVGFVARYSAVGVRTMAVAVAQTSPSFEESAGVFGAPYFRRLAAIVFPMHLRSVLGAAVLAFIFCLRDLETAVLFYPPGGEPLTVRIFTLEANGPPAVVAGLAVVHVLMTLAALLVGAMVLARRS